MHVARLAVFFALTDWQAIMQSDPSFVAHRPILSDTDRQRLYHLAARLPLAQFRADTRNYEEMAVDFVFTSARIEGNTYDRIDTDNLLRLGVTAGGKRFSDAIMLVNLRDGFARVMAIEPDSRLDLDYLCDLHKILMKDLLPVHEQGIVRTTHVTIGGSSYDPPADPARLRTEIRFILPEASRYTDPFERAIYLHCNLAYLQYFRDGNKRTARLMQTAALVQGNVLPLFFHDSLIDRYQRATVHYYETGDYAPYVSFFIDNYALAISRLLGDVAHGSDALTSAEARLAADEYERRLAMLPSLERAGGPAHILWALAQEALNANGSPDRVNWPDIERRTLVESIARHGHDPEGVAAVLCKYSPGAVTPEQQQAILEDVGRLGEVLLAEYQRSRVSRASP